MSKTDIYNHLTYVSTHMYIYLQYIQSAHSGINNLEKEDIHLIRFIKKIYIYIELIQKSIIRLTKSTEDGFLCVFFHKMSDFVCFDESEDGNIRAKS